MDTKNTIKFLIVSTFVISFILTVGKVYSETLETSGNASSSNNSIELKQTESSIVNQSNSVNLNNNANAHSNTGGNSIEKGVGGGSIKTGNANSNVNINNQFNDNNADINCKNCPTPTHQPAVSVITPTQAPSGNGVSVGGIGGGDGGQGGAGQAPAVLGLAAASGEKSLFQIIPGLLSILLGMGLIKKRV